MITRLFDNLKSSLINNYYVVVGHKKESIENLVSLKAKCIYQENQLGTAHAVNCARKFLEDKNGLTIILNGDSPMFKANIINEAISNHINSKSDLTIITCHQDNPFGYGRVIKSGNILEKIIEQSETDEKNEVINEVYSGVMLVDNKILFDNIIKIKNNNKKGEYGITDLIKILKAEDYKLNIFKMKDKNEQTGINNFYKL